MAEIVVSLLPILFLVLGVHAAVQAEAPRHFQGVTLMQDKLSESAVAEATSHDASSRRPNRLIRGARISSNMLTIRSTGTVGGRSL